jgi:molybdopterin converting factor small subunit
MVIINFKLQDIESVQLSVDEPQKFERILQRCKNNTGFELGGFIAVRNNMVITETDLVEDLDEVDVFPALSGG